MLQFTKRSSFQRSCSVFYVYGSRLIDAVASAAADAVHSTSCICNVINSQPKTVGCHISYHSFLASMFSMFLFVYLFRYAIVIRTK